MSRTTLVFGGAALAFAAQMSHAIGTLPVPPNPPNPPDPGSIVSVPTLAQPPTVYDSYHVMCEQGGLRFNLGGGLLYLDPDTLQVTSIAQKALGGTPLGPVMPAVDIPDRYQAANCSSDGGRTWGHVILDFYAPNFGESSLMHTGFEDLVLGEQRSDQHEEIPADQEVDLNALMQEVQDLIGGTQDLPQPEKPVVPSLPSPLYTVDVTYRGPAGALLSTSQPGVIGVPTVVPVASNNLVPEALVVQIGPSQTAQADGTVSSSGYELSIQRISSPSVTATCSPLEANVKVRLSVANPTAPGYPNNASGSFELGYETLGKGGASAPSTFKVKYESSTATAGPTRNDFIVDETQVPSCGHADPLDIVGHFIDLADPARSDDDVDLTLDLAMPKGTNWTLKRTTDPSYKMTVTSTSPLPLGTLNLHGRNKGKSLDATVSSIPENVTVCSHTGNLCNESWRLDRHSEVSFYVHPRDANDKPARMGVSYSEADAQGTIALNLGLSDLAYDSYIGRFSLAELPGPISGGDYPKWFYIDTLGEPIDGNYYSQLGKHWLSINLGSGTRIWGREVVMGKRWYGMLTIDFWGYISCSGFSIGMDYAGKFGGYLLGQAICRG